MKPVKKGRKPNVESLNDFCSLSSCSFKIKLGNLNLVRLYRKGCDAQTSDRIERRSVELLERVCKT